MAEETLPSKRAMIFWGLFSAGMGLFIMVGAAGLFGIDLHPAEGVPVWIGACAGAMFVAGGLALIAQSLAGLKASPDGNIPPDAPTWARWTLPALGLTIAGGFATIALWVAFGQGPRHFSVVGTFGSDHVNEMLGRGVFGFGALLACAIFVAFAVRTVKQLMGRGGA